MDLHQFPDDWLEDIFLCLCFLTRWRLQRCCSQWRRVMRSEHVNRVVVFEVKYPDPGAEQNWDFSFFDGHVSACPQATFDKFDSALDTANKYVKNIVCKGDQLAHYNTSVFIHASDRLIRRSMNISDETTLRPRYHFVFLDLTPTQTYFAVPYDVFYQNVLGLELHNVTFFPSSLWGTLFFYWNYRRSGCLRVLSEWLFYFTQLPEVPFVVKYYKEPERALLGYDHRDVEHRFLLDILPPLDANRLAQTQQYVTRMEDGPQRAKIHKAVEHILTSLEPYLSSTLNLTTDRSVDLARFPPVVPWLIYAWIEKQLPKRGIKYLRLEYFTE